MSAQKRVAALVQECYDLAAERGQDTRTVAHDLINDAPADLVRFMAAEFVVGAVARAQRAAALEAERAAERERTRQAQERAGSSPSGRIPRKGTAARDDWERNTPEGRAWARAEDEATFRHTMMMHGVIKRALDRYTEEMRIQWTAELLDTSFALRDGTETTWGDATIEQHEARRQMFLDNAHANMEGAARHEIAVRELREAGVTTLREMVGVAA